MEASRTGFKRGLDSGSGWKAGLRSAGRRKTTRPGFSRWSDRFFHATSPGILAGIFRLDFFPENGMRNATSFSKPLSSRCQDRLQLWRVPHKQALKILLAFGPEQNRYRFALARDDYRTFPGGLHVFDKIGGDFVFSCNFHSSTCSPAIKRRLPSFTPMA